MPARSRPRPSQASQEAGPSKKAAPVRASSVIDDEDGEDDLIEEEGWTQETFKNRVIDRQNPAAVPQLRQMVDKMKEFIRRLEEGLDLAVDTAKALEDSKEDEPSINEVEKAFFRILDQREIVRLKIGVLEEMVNQLRAGHQYTDIGSAFEDLLAPREKAYLAKSDRAKYKNSKDYADFRSAIWEINHDSACPPVSEWLEKGDDDESDEDDFDIGGTTQNYRCPITLMPYEDATTSVKCGHHYSRAAIVDLIESARKAKRPSKCPVTGCQALLDKTDLKPNPSLQKRTDEHQKRMRRREDEQEDGDETIAIDEDDED
ncbi:uncharacterized protein I303_105065 [Kwoniella dejecticola CBS 10117]|uniref:SP-RING-type domain-containing protein n=1 Tax=Kwoniella dejecticola CBS 10117 TaxID=1296121 RepID=A0A1A6A3J7_9TREE|nr:uncharacterized protein I303_05489 [Kwoniella dejecticola CBS 10117]OBR84630.1 hypothetical protein I303_05489 [Kwoniella dejecticola CBS 10117]